jgi:hypothetical protein
MLFLKHAVFFRKTWLKMSISRPEFPLDGKIKMPESQAPMILGAAQG